MAVSAESQRLSEKRCVPCESKSGAGGPPTLDREAAEQLLPKVEGWEMVEDSEHRLRIRRRWTTSNFVKGLELCKRIGGVAEAEGHHPDLHLEGWNKVTAELFTHSRNGLTENDFIVAAKINELELADLVKAAKKKDSLADLAKKPTGG